MKIHKCAIIECCEESCCHRPTLNSCCQCRCRCCCCRCCGLFPPEPTGLYVSYSPNGGSGGVTDLGLCPGDSYTIRSAEEAGITRTGHTFLRWNTEPDGTGVTYIPGQRIVVVESLVLYAQWSAAEV